MESKDECINLFLMDGTPNGIIKCTRKGWTGVAYKIPRTELENCRGRQDLSKSGIYFLFGITDDTDKNMVYVGRANARKSGKGILNRLLEHKRDPDKDYWTEAVVFTTSDGSFGPTEITYLENEFLNLSKNAKRYIVKNDNDTNQSNIIEEQEGWLKEFINYAKIMMWTLGHKVFEKLVQTSFDNKIEQIDNELSLYHTFRNDVNAECKRTNEGFVVLKGSYIQNETSSLPHHIKELRENSTIDENRILQEDVLLRSPSAAAGFVYGCNTNGWTFWKTKDGKTLDEVENRIVSKV